MKVLMISLDSSIVHGGSQDTLSRHVTYSSFLEKLIMFIKVRDSKGYGSVVKINDHLIIYPVPSRNSITFSLKVFFKIIRLVKTGKFEFDLITTQDPFFTGFLGYFIKKIYQKPLIVQIHGDFLDNKFWTSQSILNNFLNTLGRFNIKNADYIRVVSKKIANNLRNISAGRISIIPVNSNISIFLKNTKEKNLTKNLKKALFVGRLEPEKNLNLLIDSAKYISDYGFPNFKFIIVGDGSLKNYLEERISKFNLKKYFEVKGKVTFDEIPKVYWESEFFILPSKYEGRARVLIEALASRLPILTTDVSGADEVVRQGKNGFIVPLDNKKIFNEKIIIFLENPAITKRMGLISQKISMKYDFSPEETGKQLVKMYKSLPEK